MREEVGTRISENIPPIPAALMEQLNRYQNTRGASVAGWTDAGCLLIGTLISIVGTHAVWRPLLGTGVLGGFTTFSTYVVDAERLLDGGRTGTALLYIGGTLVTALLATAAGHRIGDAVRRDT